MFDQIIESSQYLLNNFPEAYSVKDYLNNRLSEESQITYQFGYFPPIKSLSVLQSMVNKDDLKNLIYCKSINDSISSRNIYSSYFEYYPLIMPFKDSYGNIVAIVGRTLFSDEERNKLKIAKYKNTIFKKGNYLFGLNFAKEDIIKKDLVYIVEGQFDVIKAREYGIKNIVALGNCHMTSYQFSLICRYTKNIILLLDNDEAGEKGRSLIITKFGKFANIQNMYIPNYKDIDEYLLNNKSNFLLI